MILLLFFFFFVVVVVLVEYDETQDRATFKEAIKLYSELGGDLKTSLDGVKDVVPLLKAMRQFNKMVWHFFHKGWLCVRARVCVLLVSACLQVDESHQCFFFDLVCLCRFHIFISTWFVMCRRSRHTHSTFPWTVHLSPAS